MADTPKPDAPLPSPRPADAAAGARPAAAKAAERPADAAAGAKPVAAKAAAPPPPLPPDPPPPADLTPPTYIAALQAAHPAAVAQVSYWVGDWTVIVPAASIVEATTFLRDDRTGLFDYCSDVTAVDWPARAERFDVVYCLYSTRLHHRVRLKVRAKDGESVPSVTSVWPAANWLEREVFDMFGVPFTGHPDLRRILMPEEWQGHPQRKDYPLEGPGEMLLEDPQEWLKLGQAENEADIE